MLKELATVVEVLKTKVWLVPNAGSWGQVVLRGLHEVQVWAKTGARRRAEAPRTEKKRILKRVLGKKLNKE